MTVTILIVTHLIAFVSGMVAMRLFTARFASTLKEHPMQSTGHGDDTVGSIPRGLRGNGWQWLAMGLLLVGIATLGLVDSHQRSEQQECFNDYANRLNAALVPRQQAAQTLQDAQQRIFDDVAASAAVDPTDKAAVKAAREKFYADLAAERAAEQRLTLERANSPYPDPPKEVCP